MTLVDQILKQADLVTDLERILKLNIDDEAVEYGMKVIKILDQIETKAKSIVEKNDIIDVKEKIRKAMTLIQESQEDLFNIHERLLQEENPKLMDKE